MIHPLTHKLCDKCLAAYNRSKVEYEKNPMVGYDVYIAYKKPKGCKCSK